MTQEFVVLLCINCNTYQVQQSKKATKWLCKVCNHKQSVKQFFGRGFAKQCREIVQQLNYQNINNHSDNEDIDSHILQDFRINDEKKRSTHLESNEDVPIVKKLKSNKDQNSFVRDISFTKANELVVNKRVSKWNQFL